MKEAEGAGTLRKTGLHQALALYLITVDYGICYTRIRSPLGGSESTCNAGDLGLIPGQEEPLEKGILILRMWYYTLGVGIFFFKYADELWDIKWDSEKTEWDVGNLEKWGQR